MPELEVLLVDDEGELVFTLAERLSMRGFSAHAVTSGEEAVALARGRAFDVAVVDVKMPGMGGLEVLRALRALHPGLPVILLTGHGSVDEGEQGMQLGAASCLFKPVAIGKLVARMKELAEGTRHG